MNITKNTGMGAVLLLTLLLASCKTATEKWLAGMTQFKELNDKSLSMQIMKMSSKAIDTSSFGYQVRIYPSKSWIEGQGREQSVNFLYHMDSCFTIQAGNASISPVMVQPISNGIANCYEYMLYFNVEKAIRLKNVELVYKDRFIDGKQYALKLN